MPEGERVVVVADVGLAVLNGFGIEVAAGKGGIGNGQVEAGDYACQEYGNGMDLIFCIFLVWRQGQISAGCDVQLDLQGICFALC